jgi:hypothetical protein
MRLKHAHISGIPCAVCVLAEWWYARTGHADYLTPHELVWHVSAPARQAAVPTPPMRRLIRHDRQVPIIDAPQEEYRHVESSRQETEAPRPAETQRREILEVAPRAALEEPASLEAYAGLPDAEQYYWAPVMLIRQGHAEVWDQDQETAAAFQRRCYDRLQAIQQERV